MKTTILLTTVLCGLFFLSCRNSSSVQKKVIYYAEWDSLGRASKKCKGLGLCNYRDCWFCDPSTLKNYGRIEFDSKTNEGYMFIELKPSDEIQNKAILNKDIFYIDEDINTGASILHKGAYKYDPSIGSSGGYKIPITIIKKH